MTAEPAPRPGRSAPRPQPTELRQPTVIVVRAMRSSDLPAVASLHRRALPSGFFARLGDRFLRGYHAGFVDGSSACALVSEVDGAFGGFVVGPTDTAAHTAFVVRRRGLLLARLGLLAMLTRPRLLREFVRTRAARYARGVVRQLRRRPPAGADPATGRTAVLVHVAVEDHARGHGVGTALVDAFADAAASAGAVEVRLITDADSRAVRFYERTGWSSTGPREARDGRAVVEFRRSLT